MRYLLIVLWMLSWSVMPAVAQVSVGIGLPGVSIGIDLPQFPELVPVPGYPVYYAPRVDSNYFFYDGMYWAYEGDNWYTSSWFNGPWELVAPDAVPVYVLRVPVRYYRQPPAYFRGWEANAPPRWGEHWGREWEAHRSGWDRGDRGSAPALAPLPVYQRQYSGDRYPHGEQQEALRRQQYRYEPRDPVVRERYQEHNAQGAPASPERGRPEPPRERSPKPQDVDRTGPPPPVEHQAPPVPRSQPRPRGGEDVQRSAPTDAPPQEHGPAMRDRQSRQPPPHPQGAVQHEQQSPRSNQKDNQGRGAQGPGHEQGHGKGHEKADKGGQDDNR